MKQIIYIDRDDAKKVEAEERNRFVYGVLSAIGIPIEEIWDGDKELSVDEKIEFKKLLQKFNITILGADGRSLDIYVDKDLIASWKVPKFALRTDLSQINPAKKIFLEMTIEYENIFEENVESNSE